MKLWCVSLCCVCLLLLSAPWKTVKPMSDVPRVARSVDDLRVGMVVAWEDGGTWDADALYDHGDVSDFRSRWPGQVVILSDPPARDWLVPATQMEALREADALVRKWDEENETEKWMLRDVANAARAVLGAAREVQPGGAEVAVKTERVAAVGKALATTYFETIPRSPADGASWADWWEDVARTALDAAREVEHE